MLRKTTILTSCFLLLFPFISESQNKADSLRSVLLPESQDTTYIQNCLALYEEIKYDQPDEAFTYLEKALEGSKELQYQKGIIDAYITLGYYLETNSMYDTALSVFQEAERLSVDANDRAQSLEALSGQGKTLRSMSQWDQAIEVILKCNALAKEGVVDSAMIAVNFNHLGNIFSDQNQFEKALNYYQKSISFIQDQERMKAISMMNIGLIHYRLEDYEKASEYFFACLETAERIDAKLVIAHSYQKIGLLKRVVDEYEEAKSYYSQAIEMFEVINDRSMLAYVHSNLAGIHSDEGNFDLAIEELLLSLSLQEEIDDRVGLCYTVNNLGLAYRDSGNQEKAIEYLSNAISLAKEVGVLLINKDAVEALSEIYAKNGNYSLAYEYYREFKVLDDSTFNEAKTSRIAELEEKYQNEQKQQEIDLLSAENQIAALELSKQENFRNYLIVAAFLLVLLIGVVYSRYQVKARANAKLKELDHLKTNFFTNISHEFRTPLTLILSPLQKLLQKSHDNESRHALGLIHRNAIRLNELINQLLDLSKLEAGKLSMQVSNGNLQEYLKIMAASFQSLADTKNITFEVMVEEAPTEAYYDENKLSQILNNLLSNAFKFTPEGQRIEFLVVMKEQIAHISVTDQGPGIPEAEQVLIFQRFHQGKNNHWNVAGTGVGLTLSRELALLHQGDIELQSKLGQGSTFTFHFPIDKADYDPSQIVEHKAKLEDDFTLLDTLETVPENTIPKEDPKGEVVLIVEDNLDLRNHMTSLLTDRFEVRLAIHGAEGLEIAKEIIPDIIITDLMMPEMDGIELSNALKQEEKTSHIPLVLLTAKADRDTKLEGLQTGADDFLTKPFDNEELVTRVDNLIVQRKKLQEKYAKKITLSPSEIDITSPDEVFIQKALKVVDQNLSNSDFSVELFQQEMAMSRMQLHRKLKGLTNFSASEFIRDLRLQRASDLLSKNGINITEVAYGCGFNSISYFTQCFKEKFGVSPSKYDEKAP